ncbi:hypothetical protein FACS189468_6560 [Spirochaetia bacterium]|nr:hypothetical protein FACS189468_6560 [Spirochaetia bacterium]
MFGKKTERSETLPEDRVALKPLLGIRPGVYLAALYSVIVLIILFFVLLYPGIYRPGSLAVFTSEPLGAAVRVDGVTLGTTPCEIFIPRGKRTVEMVLPGFTPFRTEAEVPARLFASLFLPRRFPITGTLSTGDPAGAFAREAAEFAQWTFAGEPTAVYQIPLVLSEGAYRIGPAARESAVHKEMSDILAASARFAATRAALRDLLRAKFLVDNGGLSPSPLTLIQSAQDIAAYLAANPGAAPALAEILPDKAGLWVMNSPWYEESMETLEEAPALVWAESRSGSLNLGNMSFRSIPPGKMVWTGGFPARQIINRLYMADTELSQEAWDAFIAANPAWGPDHREDLVARGLVTQDYLVSSDHPGYPQPAVPGVSWHAAAAYCRWLTEQLPLNLAGYEVRLPTEAEWEYAARIAAAGTEEDLPQGLLGGLWEWCADPYAPLSFFSAPPEAIAAVSSPERSVRGGSWINPPGSVDAETRASLPPDSCSPFVSFRPVIALRGELPGDYREPVIP